MVITRWNVVFAPWLKNDYLAPISKLTTDHSLKLIQNAVAHKSCFIEWYRSHQYIHPKGRKLVRRAGKYDRKAKRELENRKFKNDRKRENVRKQGARC